VALHLGCPITPQSSIQVVVAHGSRLEVAAMVKEFKWKIQQTTFTFDIFLIPLGCCELVLGIEGLVTLGYIVCNFDKLVMEFKFQGNKHMLR